MSKQRLWLAALLLCMATPMWAIEQRILIIHSYHQQFVWTAEINRALMDRLLPLVPRENIHIEYLDDRRFIDDAKLRQHMTAVLTHKYQHHPPELIITTDDSALSLVLNELSSWASQVPLVFGGVNIPEQHDFSQHPLHTGVYEGMAVEQNLGLIKQLLPQTRSVFMIADQQSLLGRRMAERARQLTENYPELELTLLTQFQLRELRQQLQQLPDHSAVLLLAIHKDTNGDYFSYLHHLPSLTAASNSPIFAMWGNLMMGTGVVGGAMNDGYRHGQNMANRIIRVLHGEPINSLSIMPQADYRPTFDYRQLRHFNIPLQQLPDDAQLLFQPVPFLQQHQKVLLLMVGIVIILFIIISVLSINIRRRAIAEQRWQHLRSELEQKVDERTSELAERNRQLSQLSENLKSQVNTDPLTGIANRRLGMKRLNRLCEQRHPTSTPLTIAILDIDFFKKINDEFGHAAGDLVLVEVASLLSLHLRPTDTIARWGGEEFLLILPDTGLNDSRNICDRLRTLVKQIQVQDHRHVTISIGVACHQSGESDGGLLERADRCLYQAKRLGRDLVITEQQLTSNTTE
ncbi:hypothetical protein CHH28_19720 [Bacterioplanes sanyensis]|uniref:diguanylate cyclase n=1 Tax=Bacterioplanes sanyensis TaxID=1249553 RepID=A0A222FPP3_9GAMM|nr:diguanylate cyclase [Bacterioplanes sanyensis]ASP40760.1 hypothetical protein CHH28_19720 [Bacterioplanes sanyensis]